MMADGRNVNLSQDESQTYLHLGIIAANTGYGASIFATRQQIASGNRDPSNDLLAWFAQQGFSDEELAELYDFRNSLFHGVVIVQSNGAVDIFDKQLGQRTYTSDQIKVYAGRFFTLRMENRTTFAVSVSHRCKCGAVFPNPEGDEEFLEHLKDCSMSSG